MTTGAAEDDLGLFGPTSVTWRMHLEPVLWIGGLRALLLQALHPRVMRGTYQNSALFDPSKAWPRFERTAEFVSIRTYGPTAEVARAAARVRGLHARLSGVDPDDGVRFRLDEPDGLLWVHCAEIDSYVDVALRAGIVDGALADTYIAENVRAAELVGLDPALVPTSRAELADYLAGMRPRLTVTAEARRGARNLFVPVGDAPLLVRGTLPPVTALAMATLPRWARRHYGLPGLPTTDLATTVALRALRGVAAVLPEPPASPRVARARALLQAADARAAARVALRSS